MRLIIMEQRMLLANGQEYLVDNSNLVFIIMHFNQKLTHRFPLCLFQFENWHSCLYLDVLLIFVSKAKTE